MKLLLRYRYEGDLAGYLRERLDAGWEIEELTTGDETLLARALERCDAVLSMSWSRGFGPASGLRLIQLPGAGFDSIDFDAVPAAAAVCNVYEHEIGIAEYLVLAMLEWEIRVGRLDAALREGRWEGSFVVGAPLHGELHGKTVGFVGCGRIATETARRLKAFGVRTLACTRTPAGREDRVDEVSGMDRLHEMLAAADYVVVTCPLTDRTRGLIGAAELGVMRAGGVIVNVARGEVIDEDALWAACRDRQIGGAVIDTWYRYPGRGENTAHPSRHPFRELDNVVMTPHASGWSAGLLARRWAIIARNLNALARGEPLVNVLKLPGEPPCY